MVSISQTLNLQVRLLTSCSLCMYVYFYVTSLVLIVLIGAATLD